MTEPEPLKKAEEKHSLPEISEEWGGAIWELCHRIHDDLLKGSNASALKYAGMAEKLL